MIRLVIRALPDEFARPLKARAVQHARSIEQEHRETSRAAPQGPRRPCVAEVLASMPNVGRDEDFARDDT